jgi:hypothetical protein
MTVHFDRVEQAEIDNAIDACLQFHTLLNRLRPRRSAEQCRSHSRRPVCTGRG